MATIFDTKTLKTTKLDSKTLYQGEKIERYYSKT